MRNRPVAADWTVIIHHSSFFIPRFPRSRLSRLHRPLVRLAAGDSACRGGAAGAGRIGRAVRRCAAEAASGKRSPAARLQAVGCRRPPGTVFGRLDPFRHNALTAGVDPIKYYEYRAAGLAGAQHALWRNGASRPRRRRRISSTRPTIWRRPSPRPWSHPRDAAEYDRFRQDNNWSFAFSAEQLFFDHCWPASRMRRAA